MSNDIWINQLSSDEIKLELNKRQISYITGPRKSLVKQLKQALSDEKTDLSYPLLPDKVPETACDNDVKGDNTENQEVKEPDNLIVCPDVSEKGDNTQNQEVKEPDKLIVCPDIPDWSLGGNTAIKVEANSDDNNSEDQYSEDFTGDEQRSDHVAMDVQYSTNIASDEHSSLEPKENQNENKLIEDVNLTNSFVPPNKVGVNKKPFGCLHCNFSAKLPSSLKKHMKAVHLKIRPFVCSHCEYSSSQYNHLKVHIQSVHEGLKPYSCDKCDFKTSSKCGIDRHVYSVHKRYKPHNCPHCNQMFSRKYNLSSHIKTVHENDKPYKCPECDYATAQNNSLLRHIDSIHRGIKQFNCEYCEYKTSLKNSLTKHVEAVHLNVRTHKCPDCDYSSSQKGVLTRHIASKHTPEKGFKCELCPFTTTRKSNLVIHINRMHRGISNKHACIHCDYEVTKKKLLFKHIITKHSSFFEQQGGSLEQEVTLEQQASSLKVHRDSLDEDSELLQQYSCSTELQVNSLKKQGESLVELHSSSVKQDSLPLEKQSSSLLIIPPIPNCNLTDKITSNKSLLKLNIKTNDVKQCKPSNLIEASKLQNNLISKNVQALLSDNIPNRVIVEKISVLENKRRIDNINKELPDQNKVLINKFNKDERTDDMSKLENISSDENNLNSSIDDISDHIFV